MTLPIVGRRRTTRASPVTATVAIGLLVTALVGCGESEPEPFAGYARTPTPNTGSISLPSVEADGSETPFAFVAGEGELLLVYFGYTSCPDVCPTTLSDIRRALDNMGGERADRVELAMVTIDVDVDSPEVLTTYVRSFVPSAVAVRSTDDSALRAAAGVFGADYGTETIDGKEEVYHTGSLYAVNDQGDILLTWPFGTPSADIEADLVRLLDGDRA